MVAKILGSKLSYIFKNKKKKLFDTLISQTKAPREKVPYKITFLFCQHLSFDKVIGMKTESLCI